MMDELSTSRFVCVYECGRDIRFADEHKLSGQVSGDWVSEGKGSLGCHPWYEPFC